MLHAQIDAFVGRTVPTNASGRCASRSGARLATLTTGDVLGKIHCFVHDIAERTTSIRASEEAVVA